MEKGSVENLIEEINDLILAKKLLKKVYTELGPYNNILDRSLTNEINNYFKFDDNE